MDGNTGNPSTNMNKEPDYSIDLRIEDIRLLHHCVIKRLERWEGFPARPAEEQEHLWVMRDSLFRMMLDYKFNEL